MREIHPGSPQERQQRVLQAQEQSPAGGVGALDGVVQLPRRVSSAIPRKHRSTPTHSVTSRLKNRHPSAHHELRNESAVI